MTSASSAPSSPTTTPPTPAASTPSPPPVLSAASGPVAAGSDAPVLIASDLDRTLIYSAGALDLPMPDTEAPRLLCVEIYQHRPLSFMTETAAGLLAGLATSTLFVPTTTRTREQYLRVQLPGPAPRYAICANGGHLLVDGVSDPDWRRTVTAALAERSAPLETVRRGLLASSDSGWVLKERVAEDLFVYLVVDRERLPAGWLTDFSAWALTQGWSVSLQGRKIYAVPQPLTKSAALREVAARTGARLTLAAGDSLLDADLLEAADLAWRPGHGELADRQWQAHGVTALTATGVRAGEELLRRFAHAASRAPGAAPGQG